MTSVASHSISSVRAEIAAHKSHKEQPSDSAFEAMLDSALPDPGNDRAGDDNARKSAPSAAAPSASVASDASAPGDTPAKTSENTKAASTKATDGKPAGTKPAKAQPDGDGVAAGEDEQGFALTADAVDAATDASDDAADALATPDLALATTPAPDATASAPTSSGNPPAVVVPVPTDVATSTTPPTTTDTTDIAVKPAIVPTSNAVTPATVPTSGAVTTPGLAPTDSVGSTRTNTKNAPDGAEGTVDIGKPAAAPSALAPSASAPSTSAPSDQAAPVQTNADTSAPTADVPADTAAGPTIPANPASAKAPDISPNVTPPVTTGAADNSVPHDAARAATPAAADATGTETVTLQATGTQTVTAQATGPQTVTSQSTGTQTVTPQATGTQTVTPQATATQTVTPQSTGSDKPDDTVKDAKGNENGRPEEVKGRSAEGAERKPEPDASAARGTPAHRATPGSEQGIASRSARATEVLADATPHGPSATPAGPETKPAEAKPSQAHAAHVVADLAGAQLSLSDTVSVTPAATATDATALDSTRASAAPPRPLAAGPVIATGTTTPNAPYAAAGLAPVPVSGLAVEIAAQARDGKSRFEIRLDPPELGRIDVHLHVDRDGTVTSRLVVERSETLDLLKRDAPTLERALQNAGLKTGDQGLEFSLRDHGAGRHQDSGHAARGSRVVVPDDVQPLGPAGNTYARRLGLGTGIDIRV